MGKGGFDMERVFGVGKSKGGEYMCMVEKRGRSGSEVVGAGCSCWWLLLDIILGFFGGGDECGVVVHRACECD